MKYDLFINGEWVKTAHQEYFPAINPFSQQEWSQISQASAAQVADAVQAARAAFDGGWSRTPGIERARLLHRLADLLDAHAERMGVLESTDNGKVVRETRSQMHFAARQYRFFAGYADKLWGKVIPLDQPDVLDYATLEPLGVAVLITAWNSPMGLLSNKLAPAIAAGNCVVIKPSEHASATTLEFTKLIAEAGFPKGVINVVTGDARVGKALTESGRVDRISFTGSPGVGREIAMQAGRRLTPVTLELGGKSPNIIFEDADFDKALVGAFAGIFAATGQTCIAGSRLLVQKSIYEKTVNALADKSKAIVLGNPVDPATEMGTLANEPHFNRVMASIESGIKSGAKLAAGGRRATSAALSQGLFVEPTIFRDVDNNMPLAREEIFGPVLSIIPFGTEEEAVQIGNDTDYGLAAGIWTTNLNRAMRMSKAIRAGSVWVNTYRAVAVQAPFGGFKDSGYGRERGEAAIEEFVTSKNVMIDYSNLARDPFAIRL